MYKSKLFYFLLIGYGLCKGLTLYAASRAIQYVPPDVVEEARMTTTELLHKFGYGTETHYALTDDGYILGMHRIVSGPKSPPTGKTQKKKVVFLMHGLPSSSADYTVFGPDIGLAYTLNDNGYDVWMGNLRGNRYSRNHTTLSPDDSKFWRFSWHESGVYDLPAMIDYVLGHTNSTSLSYIGFSQGTTVFFVMCSERPEYMKKINHMQALSPVVFMNRTNSRILRVVGYYANNLDFVYKAKGPYEFLPTSQFTQSFGEIVCNERTYLNSVCTFLLFELCGYDFAQFNLTKLPIFVGHIPAGTSNMNVMHFGQSIATGNFRKFDHGKQKNLELYGTEQPPDYKLDGITVPIVLHCSDNDLISHPDDILRLKNILPNVIGLFKPTLKDFNHVDFVLAIDSKKLIHPKILEMLNKYS